LTPKPHIVKVPSLRGATRLMERVHCGHSGCRNSRYRSIDHILELRHSFEADGVAHETFVCRCGEQLTVRQGQTPACPHR
jgi:hypothetical protein